MKRLTDDELAEFTRKGAEVTLMELFAEIERIYDRFPQLRKQTSGNDAEPSATTTQAAPARPARRRPHWTPAMKRAARERMKKYWASRKAATRSNT